MRFLKPMLDADRIKQTDIAERLGVDQGSISKWVNHGIKRGLHSHTRSALSHMLDELRSGHWPPSESSGNGKDGGVGGTDVPSVSSLARQIDAILSGEGEAWEKGVMLAEVEAAYRASALEWAERAATKRAAALEMAAERALLREKRTGVGFDPVVLSSGLDAEVEAAHVAEAQMSAGSRSAKRGLTRRRADRQPKTKQKADQ